MRYYWLIICLLGSLLKLDGQDAALLLSLEEAKEYAIMHNKSLQNAKNDVRLAELQIDEVFTAAYPQFSGGMDYMTNFNYEVEFEFGSTNTDPPEIDYTKLDAGDAEVLSLINQLFGPSEPATIKMGDQLRANVQVSQLLFNGQVWAGLQMAKIGRELARKSILLSEVDVREQVVSLYHMILVTQDLLGIMERNKLKMEEVKTHTENLFKVGMAEQTDVDQIGVTLSQLVNGIRAMERNLEISFNMLRFILGLESNKPLKLSTSLDELLTGVSQSVTMRDELDISANPGYQLLQGQEQLNEKNISLQKWAWAPTLVGFYSYTEKLVSSGFDLSPNHAAGISLSVPIWDGNATRLKVSKAKIELDKVRKSKEMMEDQLSLQYAQARYDVQNAMDNFNTQKETVEVAKRVLVSYEHKYRQGIISSLELTQANMNYLQSEQNFVSSMMDLLAARRTMDKLLNRM